MGNYFIMGREVKQNIDFSCVPFCIESDSDTLGDKLHVHDFHQLTIVVKGTATIVINSLEQSIHAGNVYVISNHSIHCLKNQNNLEVFNIFFYIGDLSSHAASLRDYHGFQSLFILQPSLGNANHLSNMLLLDYEGIYYVNSIVSLLLEELKHPSIGKDIIVQSYFMILIVYFSRQYGKNQSYKTNTEELYKIITYMNENYDKSITIKDLLDISYLSERQLQQLFAEHYNYSPMKYLNYLHIKHACYLLAISEMTITEIAYKVGFNDSNYFSRKFSQIQNMSPREYRAMSIQHISKEMPYKGNIF